MKMLVQCHASSEYADWSGVALLTLSQEAADRLRIYVADVGRLNRLRSTSAKLVVPDLSCTYYEVEAEVVLDRRLLDLFDTNAHVIVPDDFAIDDERETPTVSDEVNVCADSFWWSAGIENAGYEVSTISMSLETITCWVHGSDEAARATCLRCLTL